MSPGIVFVVWEPVLLTDMAPPTNRVLLRVDDPRALQFWDPGRALSKAMLTAALAETGGSMVDSNLDADEGQRLDKDTVVWDFIAIFPPGARWEERFPEPDFYGFPVVEKIGDVARRLGSQSGAS